jgi:hypothetical protein
MRLWVLIQEAVDITLKTIQKVAQGETPITYSKQLF